MAAAKLETLQVGRGLAALAVVVFHAHTYFIARELYPGTTLFAPFNLGYAGVEYFFVLSGFIIYHVHARDVGRPERLGRFAHKRVTRVYPVYWVVLGLIVAAAFAVPGFGPDGATDPVSILSDAALLPSEGAMIVHVAWTLRHEMLFYLVFALFIVDARLGAAATALLLGGALAQLLGLVRWNAFVFSSYHFLFAFGALAAVGWSRVPARGAGPLVAVGVVAFLAVGLADLYGHWPFGPGWRAVAFGLAATLAVAAAVRWETTRASRASERRTSDGRASALVFLGDASYSIYLAHAPAISFGSAVIAALGINDVVPAWPMLGVLVAGGLVAGIGLHVLVERPLLAAFKPRSRAAVEAARERAA